MSDQTTCYPCCRLPSNGGTLSMNGWLAVDATTGEFIWAKRQWLQPGTYDAGSTLGRRGLYWTITDTGVFDEVIQSWRRTLSLAAPDPDAAAILYDNPRRRLDNIDGSEVSVETGNLIDEHSSESNTSMRFWNGAYYVIETFQSVVGRRRQGRLRVHKLADDGLSVVYTMNTDPVLYAAAAAFSTWSTPPIIHTRYAQYGDNFFVYAVPEGIHISPAAYGYWTGGDYAWIRDDPMFASVDCEAAIRAFLADEIGDGGSFTTCGDEVEFTYDESEPFYLDLALPTSQYALADAVYSVWSVRAFFGDYAVGSYVLLKTALDDGEPDGVAFLPQLSKGFIGSRLTLRATVSPGLNPSTARVSYKFIPADDASLYMQVTVFAELLPCYLDGPESPPTFTETSINARYVARLSGLSSLTSLGLTCQEPTELLSLGATECYVVSDNTIVKLKDGAFEWSKQGMVIGRTLSEGAYDDKLVVVTTWSTYAASPRGFGLLNKDGDVEWAVVENNNAANVASYPTATSFPISPTRGRVVNDVLLMSGVFATVIPEPRTDATLPDGCRPEDAYDGPGVPVVTECTYDSFTDVVYLTELASHTTDTGKSWGAATGLEEMAYGENSPALAFFTEDSELVAYAAPDVHHFRRTITTPVASSRVQVTILRMESPTVVETRTINGLFFRSTADTFDQANKFAATVEIRLPVEGEDYKTYWVCLYDQDPLPDLIVDESGYTYSATEIRYKAVLAEVEVSAADFAGPMTLTVHDDGFNIGVDLNGVRRITVANSERTSNKHIGLLAHNATAYFDDLSACPECDVEVGEWTWDESEATWMPPETDPCDGCESLPPIPNGTFNGQTTPGRCIAWAPEEAPDE